MGGLQHGPYVKITDQHKEMIGIERYGSGFALSGCNDNRPITIGVIFSSEAKRCQKGGVYLKAVK